MKATIKYIFITTMLSAFCTVAIAQKYYIHKTDASGIIYNPDPLPQLEAVAKELVETLPENIQADFKVFDFGFYLHQENTTGGFPEPFEYIKKKVAEESKYYLLFAKQSDQYGFHTKIWLDLKLPTDGVFSCLKETQRSLFKLRLEKAISDAYALVPNKYPFAEDRCMRKMMELVNKQKECCVGNKGDDDTCDFTSREDRISYFEKLGFIRISCKIKKLANKSDDIDDSILNKTQIVEDYSNLSFYIDGNEYNAKQFVEEIVLKDIEFGFNSKGFASINDNFLNGIIDDIKQKITQNDTWMHIDEGNEKLHEEDLLYIGCNLNQKWTISNHFKLTYNALSYIEYENCEPDLLAHYASIFADHPPVKFVTINNINYNPKDWLYYRDDIIYSKTENSQDTKWNPNTDHNKYNYNIWHSMRSYDEMFQNKISEIDAMIRGMEFGWNKILDSAKKGKLSDLKKNTEAIEDFGQGIHAIQDAFAHRGGYLKESISNSKDLFNVYSHVKNDFREGTNEHSKALHVTKAALFAYLLISNDYKALDKYFEANKSSPFLDLKGDWIEIVYGISADFRSAFEMGIENYKKNTKLTYIKI